MMELPPELVPGPGRHLIVEVPRSREASTALRNRLAEESGGQTTLSFSVCNRDRRGVWAGLSDLFETRAHDIARTAPELIRRHSRELFLIVPAMRKELSLGQFNLTDLAVPEEKVRNYPMDRAYRIVQGAIDLLAAWQSRQPAGRWIILCERFDEAGALVQRFYRELLRRQGDRLNLSVIFTVRPGAAGQIELGSGVETNRVPWAGGERLEEDEERRTPLDMERLAEELEEQGRKDPQSLSPRLSELVYYWKRSAKPERSLIWVGYLFSEYNHFGFYEDALPYGLEILENLDTILTLDSPFTRWNLVGALANCYLALKRPEDALGIVEREGIDKVTDPVDLSRVFYVLALINSRFLPRPDFAAAESYLARGQEALLRADLPDYKRCFYSVFLDNGLAYIRHRQGRPQEALDLCKSGFDHLQTVMQAGQHLLHRSVLLYNIAQVYTSLREWEKAIHYYGATMELDPNYSEYYNERGSAYLNLGRLDEAISDYQRAIDLSAPYQEVWTNLGQALKLKQRFAEAVAAYTRALDLEPGQLLPRLGRAQSLDALGQLSEAVADYTVALELDPAAADVWANRASLWYDLGELHRAAEDLHRALTLEEDNPGFLKNRSVVLAALGRKEEAVLDLQRLLELTASPNQRAEIESQIALLRMTHAIAERPEAVAVQM